MLADVAAYPVEHRSRVTIAAGREWKVRLQRWLDAPKVGGEASHLELSGKMK